MFSCKSDSWRRCTCTNVLFSLVACDGCLEVCFMGLFVEEICVWCLVIVAIFMVWVMLKSHQLRVAMQVTQGGGGGLFIGKAGSHYVILLYYETLLHVLQGIYCKRFYWISLFTILLLFYVFEAGKAKSANQSVLMILPLYGLFQKNFQVFYFTPENSIPLTLPSPPPLSVCFFPL